MRDELATPEHRLDVGPRPRQGMQRFERYLSRSSRALDVHDGTERQESHTHVRRMHRDALLAAAEDRVLARIALASSAARPGRALVTGGHGDVAEIATTRP